MEKNVQKLDLNAQNYARNFSKFGHEFVCPFGHYARIKHYAQVEHYV